MSYNENGYCRALLAAGFEIIDSIECGDYSGTWLAFVRYQGKAGFIIDSYGSCGGCDSFEHDVPNETPESLKAFGLRYVDELQTYEEALKYASRNVAWDMESQAMVDFVKNNQYKEDFNNIVKENNV